jgi:hypothetical protein
MTSKNNNQNNKSSNSKEPKRPEAISIDEDELKELEDQGSGIKLDEDAFDEEKPEESKEEKADDGADEPINDEDIPIEKDRSMGVETGPEGKRELLMPEDRIGVPFIKDQAERYPHTVSLHSVKNHVLDLSDEKDLKKLDDLETRALNPDGGLSITHNEPKFIEAKNTWMVFLKVAYYAFKPIMK